MFEHVFVLTLHLTNSSTLMPLGHLQEKEREALPSGRTGIALDNITRNHTMAKRQNANWACMHHATYTCAIFTSPIHTRGIRDKQGTGPAERRLLTLNMLCLI